MRVRRSRSDFWLLISGFCLAHTKASRRGLSPRGMRGWRAEKRKILWLRIRCRTRQAPFGAPHARHAEAIAHVYLRRFATAGPAFAIGAPPAILTPFPAPLHSALAKRLGRSDRRRLAWALRSSASSWQGFLVSPGGAPPPPECLAANQARGAPHPVPPQQTPRDGAPQWTRCAEFRGGCGGGDKFWLR
jgi:hypothetical protein